MTIDQKGKGETKVEFVSSLKLRVSGLKTGRRIRVYLIKESELLKKKYGRYFQGKSSEVDIFPPPKDMLTFVDLWGNGQEVIEKTVSIRKRSRLRVLVRGAPELFRVVPCHEDWVGTREGRNLLLKTSQHGPCPISSVLEENGGAYPEVSILLKQRAKLVIRSRTPSKKSSWSLAVYRNTPKEEGELIGGWIISRTAVFSSKRKFEKVFSIIPGKNVVTLERATGGGLEKAVDLKFSLFAFPWEAKEGEKKVIQLDTLRPKFSFFLWERYGVAWKKEAKRFQEGRMVLVRVGGPPSNLNKGNIGWIFSYAPGKNLQIAVDFPRVNLEWLSGIDGNLTVEMGRKRNFYFKPTLGWK